MTDERDAPGGAWPDTGTAPDAAPRMRVAEVFDGRGPHGGVLIKRPAVEAAEFDALTRYLTTAPVALATAKTGQDELSPDAGMAVPRAYHTDGFWIWPAAVGYYLHLYRLPPQAELVAHIRARGFEVGVVPEPIRQAAAAQMLEELAAARRRGPEAKAPEARAKTQPRPEAAAEPTAAEQVPAAAASLWLPAPAPDEEAAPAAETEPETATAAETQQGAPEQDAPEPNAAEPAPAEPLWSFSSALTAIGNRHAAWVFEQIEAFVAFMPVDEWSVDHERRLYRQAGRQFTVDALGRLAEDGRWTWAWAEPEAWSADPRITERVRTLCADGGGYGIEELRAPVLDLAANADAQDPETAAEMLAWTLMGLTGARGYIGHSQGGRARVYYLAFDEAIPTAKPDLGEMPRYLTQGVLKFEEDATDCVLGYIEHHGWDWSRSADGIEVSAAGLGTFTADLSDDGALTGISLH